MPVLTQADVIQARVSARQASEAASEFEEGARQERVAAGQAVQPPVVKFEQNNYSPESLSHVEIYRHTKNQLSQVKRGVGLAVGSSV